MKKTDANYAKHKNTMRERQAVASEDGRNIAPIPPTIDPERRQAAEDSFQTFCETYLADIFTLAWSPDHFRVITKIETAVNTGGLFAIAMPRGSGKTALCVAAVIWAVATGRSRFACLIAASAPQAVDRITDIKTILETNQMLFEDFPEICYPIRRLDRIIQRQRGQHVDGEYTRMEFVSDKIVLPTISGSKSSGAVITSSGLKGSDIRGQHHVLDDGTWLRPDIVMVDDPQTRESAYSPRQNNTRESLLAGDVLGMAGPGKKIAGLMACTVICQGDMADNILDRQKHPEWQGERTKMVYSFPVNEGLWNQYAEMRAEEFQADGDGSKTTEFYRQHQAEMDKGAVVAWEQRYNDDELSAIQHAMNLRYRDEYAFFAEYQNEPKDEIETVDMMTADEIAAKINRIKRGVVPMKCSHLTMFIDVHANLLYWMVCAWESNFTGYIIDYGTFPDQKRGYFTLNDTRVSISKMFPSAGLEGQTYAALDRLVQERLQATYMREDDAPMQVQQVAIDANWGSATDVVYQFVKQSVHQNRVLPWHGKYYGASSTPMSEYSVKAGTRNGLHWQIRMHTERRARYILSDVNYWKTFVHSRLAIAMADPGCLSLFGSKTQMHRLLSEHLTSQYPVRTEAQGRTVDEWKVKPGRPDDHWFDCLVGCAVCASILGVTLGKHIESQKQERKTISFADLQRQARQKRG